MRAFVFRAILRQLGVLFFAVHLLNAGSHLGAAWLARKIGLLNTMVFTHLPSSLFLIAVPFAVTTGKRGAMYGIGVGIVLAMVYWIAISVFGAIGAGGVMSPVLAAWAPNILFGAAAGYMLLTVRT